MTLYIKNMVCPRCTRAVEEILSQLGIDGHVVTLGHVETREELSDTALGQFETRLDEAGFELLHDRQSQQVEQVKTLLRDLVYKHDARLEGSLSQYVATHMGRDYTALSRSFTEVHGVSIERYFISLKIERVKELMFYGELTLSEIAYQLNYSSVAHLSGQFKRETGLSPMQYKQGKHSHNGIL